LAQVSLPWSCSRFGSGASSSLVIMTVQQIDRVREIVCIEAPTEVCEVVEVPKVTLTAPPEPADVLLRGLPANLCDEEYIKLILENAGLDKKVSDIRVNNVTGFSEACLTFSDKKVARKVARHFDRCQWNGFRVNAVLADYRTNAIRQWSGAPRTCVPPEDANHAATQMPAESDVPTSTDPEVPAPTPKAAISTDCDPAEDANHIATIPCQMPAESDVPTLVALHGLPKLLCNELALQAVLEQAHLSVSLVSIIVPEGGKPGDAFATFVNSDAAERCVKHFTLCRWARCNVAACIVEARCEGHPGVGESPSTHTNPADLAVNTLDSTLSADNTSRVLPKGLVLTSLGDNGRRKRTPSVSSGGSTRPRWADMSDDDGECSSSSGTTWNGWDAVASKAGSLSGDVLR